MTLEEAIRASADRGKLNHLSIAHTTRGWQVGYRGALQDDHRMVTHADPVCALMAALTGKAGEAPPVKRRKRSTEKSVTPTPPTDDFDDLLG